MLKQKVVSRISVLLIVFGLSGCETVQVLDARLSARLQQSGWLRPTPAWVIVSPTGKRVALHHGPGVEQSVIRRLASGTTVTPLGAVGAWRAVRVGEDTGFVRDRDLRLVSRDQRFAQS